MKNILISLIGNRWLKFSLGLLFLLIFFLSEKPFIHSPYSQSDFLEIHTDSLTDTEKLTRYLTDNDISNYSVFDKVPFFDWTGWQSFSLADLDKQFFHDDPRNLKVYSDLRELYRTDRGQWIVFIERSRNPYWDWLRLRNRPAKARSSLNSNWIYISIFSLLILAALLLIPQTKESRSALVFIILIAPFTDPLYLPLYPFLVYSRILSRHRDEPARSILKMISLGVILSITFLSRNLYVFFMLSISLSLIEGTKRKTEGVDHTLFKPILLLGRDQNPPAQQPHFLYLFLTLILISLSILTVKNYNESGMSQMDSRSSTGPGIIDRLYEGLAQERAFFVTRAENWGNMDLQDSAQTDYISEIPGAMIPIEEMAQYWQKWDFNTLFQRLDTQTDYIHTVQKVSYIFVLLYFVIWLTIPVSLWQSRKTFSKNENFVFKMRRRLEVA